MTTCFDRYIDKNVLLKRFSKVEVFRNGFKGASEVVYYHKGIIKVFIIFSTSYEVRGKKEERKKERGYKYKSSTLI